jgi:hypothetical protein
MKALAVATILAIGLASPSFAAHCPKDMSKIEAALKTATVDDATKKKITDLYNKGKAEHEAGKHADSVATLAEAMKLLGIS